MNLYNIIFSHHAPSDSEYGTKCLLLAENDEQVYDWIANHENNEDDENYLSFNNTWKSNEEYSYNKERGEFVDKDGDETGSDGWYDEEGNPELFKERMIRLKGETDDEISNFSNAYYGVTLYGWELIKENTTADYSELIEANFLFNAKNN